MAHGLTIDANGNAEFIFNEKNGTPWHKLGTAVDGFLTPTEAARRVLPWKVETVPLRTEDGLEIPGTRGLVRVNPDGSRQAFPGSVGRRYVPIQNDTIARTLEALFGAANAVVDTVGALGVAGERIFFLAKLPTGFEVTRGDEVATYFLAENVHGVGAARLRFCATRVVCQNTLGIALREAGSIISVRHTANAEQALKQGAEILAAGTRYWADLRAYFASLAERQMDAAAFKNFIEALIPGEANDEGVIEVTPQARRARERITALFEGEAVGSELSKGSAWSAYNAVTQYIDRDRPVRTGTIRIENSLFSQGPAAALRQRAADLLASA